MSTLTQSKVPLQFLLSEGNGQISRANITVLSGEGKLEAGRVLGRTATAATVAVAAKAGNTGNGVFTIDGTTPFLGSAKPGRYVVECIEPGANVGTFQVTDPSGVVLGSHVVAGAAFANGIKFTIADGATDFVSGDAFFVDVSGVSYKYRSTTLTNTDGSAVGVAVLGYAVDATSADQSAMAIVRESEVKSGDLVYDSTVNSATLIAQKVFELAAAGIFVR
jgi:hypothetical protein